MSIVVRHQPAGLTAEKYDATTEQFEAAGIEWPPDGLDHHICFGTDGDLRVSEIWDSREKWEAFSEKLRDEVDLEALSDDLVGMVAETMQPTHASLWLRPATDAKGKKAD